MSLKCNLLVGRDIRLQSLRSPQVNIIGTSFHRSRRRPRLKRSAYHQLSLSSYSSQDNLTHAFLSQLNSLDLLAPALGFTTALAILYNSNRTTSTTHLSHEIGDWTLFTSPTPFNRFLKSRCSSLLLDYSNEELVKEDGHLVASDRGRIQQVEGNDYHVVLEKQQLSYQRLCVNTDDGGVVSLDWPAGLVLTEEHGLDTTILIVPGTTDGSMDENVRSFVYECLKRGCFPIVMNPRGCARSPLITPRLFTAADSDDIRTTVQFINKARPWTTLMGVGLGYGANMLTKYLAEVGEKTPLTAATCLDNPFDLKGCAASPNRLYVDQNLTGGLIDILQSNKELFQGQSKGFDVERALQARSLKDFEEAISMVSYGFDSIEEFYVNSSSRDVVGDVKIPLLFIQNNAVPSCSIPHSLIVENPFTSLLMCSFPSYDKNTTGTSAVSWCQHLVIEWLTAVELGLLKGRHPLLEDSDVTINPSKRLKLMASNTTHASSKSNNLLNLHQFDALDGNAAYTSNKMMKRSDAYVFSNSGLDSQKSKAKDKEVKTDSNGMVTQTNLEVTELVKEGDVDVVDGERGKVLQASEVVMNMLDKKMPKALSEEQKNKVLAAVGQGETLMNALEGAVPEDVRGKLTSAVTVILQNQKKNLNGLSSISSVPDVTLGLNTNMQEKSGLKEPNTSEHNKGDTSTAEKSNNHPSNNGASGGGEEPGAQTLGNPGISEDTSQLPSTSHHGGDIPSLEKTSHDELGSNNQSADSSEEKAAQSSSFHDANSSAMPNVSSRAEKYGSSDDQVREQVKLEHGGETTYSDMKEEKDAQPKEEKDAQPKEEKDAQFSTDQRSNVIPRTEESLLPSASSLENQLMAKDDSENQKKEESSAQPAPSHSSSNSPSFSVSQAFDALTGMDDSTQVAVNSVFSVIEDMITQLEGNGDDETGIGDINKVEDKAADSEPKKNQTEIESDLQHTQLEGNRDDETAIDDINKVEDKAADSEPTKNQTEIESDLQHTQLEGNRDDETAIDDINKVEDEAADSEPKKNQTETESDLQQKGDGKSNMTTEPNELDNHQQSMSISKLFPEEKDKAEVFNNNRDDIPHSIAKLPYRKALYDHHGQSYVRSSTKNNKLLDSDATTALFLDYVPEVGQWKLLEQSPEGIDINVESTLPTDVECHDDIVEPSYVILEAESDWDPLGEYKKRRKTKEKLEIGDDASVVLMQLVKENILTSLKVEVCRRIQATDMEDIAPVLKKELEHVADTISLAVAQDKQLIMSWDGEHLLGPGNLHAEHILDAISSAVQGTRYMKKVIPVGIVVGSSLASLRKKFNIATADSVGSIEVVRDQIGNSQKGYQLQADSTVSDQMPIDKVKQNNNLLQADSTVSDQMPIDKVKQNNNLLQADSTVSDQMPIDKVKQNNNFHSLEDSYEEKDVSSSLGSDTVMVGAVTAALGASALLVHQQDSYSDGLGSSTTSSMSFNQKEHRQEPRKPEEEMSKSSEPNIVTSLAEKAMSVAGPVVPMKEGEVDQERLVALLADLGQRGGILRLVGKLALLWGGIRGAMSLTGKLISFLHLADRPLFQRILGFVFMVLVLWTPVVVPLLPTLVQNWATHNSSNIAELACVIGLYGSIMILIVLWGKRIRGYEDPLERYGIELTSARQIQNFLCGLIGGVMLVLLIQYTNVLLGFVRLSWPTVPSSTDAVTLLKLYGNVLKFVGQGLVTSISVALVEELFFRSWLPEEIAADLGYNRGIILSGLAFSLCQWSLKAVPGLWLLSLGLAGVRQRCQGSLSVPIGLRAGIMASSFVLKAGGLLTYAPTYPLWASAGDPFQPFNSIVGLAVALLLAVVLYPKKPRYTDREQQGIKDTESEGNAVCAASGHVV
ncbi:hypothetical protein L6452_21420 [Arctium lappa]|uniref:Uncharacterized protein n=1 Tax=Arctium lappa TaxID=4217 RepID=A0ACB9AXL6_ARCLA|nr:hypothetical protein L6452_21420 [Arctium lappa]